MCNDLDRYHDALDKQRKERQMGRVEPYSITSPSDKQWFDAALATIDTALRSRAPDDSIRFIEPQSGCVAVFEDAPKCRDIIARCARWRTLAGLGHLSRKWEETLLGTCVGRYEPRPFVSFIVVMAMLGCEGGRDIAIRSLQSRNALRELMANGVVAGTWTGQLLPTQDTVDDLLMPFDPYVMEFRLAEDPRTADVYWDQDKEIQDS
ncbi:MAG: hypothetical protein ACYDHY_18190 [Acidiferrobacterales bacterium]